MPRETQSRHCFGIMIAVSLQTIKIRYLFPPKYISTNILWGLCTMGMSRLHTILTMKSVFSGKICFKTFPPSIIVLQSIYYNNYYTWEMRETIQNKNIKSYFTQFIFNIITFMAKVARLCQDFLLIFFFFLVWNYTEDVFLVEYWLIFVHTHTHNIIYISTVNLGLKDMGKKPQINNPLKLQLKTLHLSDSKFQKKEKNEPSQD